jgi:ribose transport system permease protein
MKSLRTTGLVATLNIVQQKWDENPILKSWSTGFGLVSVIILFAILTHGRSLSARNIEIVFVQSLIITVAALGSLFVAATGNLDLSIGGIIGIASVIGWTASSGAIHLSVLVFACIATGIVCSCVVGFLNSYLNIPGLFVGIVMMSVGKCVAALATQKIQMLVPSSVAVLDKTWFYVVVVLVIVITAYFILNHTVAGLFIKATGSNRVASEYSGVNTRLCTMAAYAIAGVTEGLAAFLLMLRLGAVTSSSGQGVEMDVILGLLVGGVSVTGGTSAQVKSALIGCFMLCITANGLILIGIPFNLINLCKGIIFILACWMSMDRKRGETLM